MKFKFVHRVGLTSTVYFADLKAENSQEALEEIAETLAKSEISTELGIGEMMGIERIE